MRTLRTGARRAHSYIRFSAGEPHVDISCLSDTGRADEFCIAVTRPTMDEIFEAFLLKDALENVYGRDIKVSLDLGYVPFGRQDRVTSSGTAFSLRVFADVLNERGFSHVSIIDPHSSVAPALIRNVSIASAGDHVKAFLERTGAASIVAPDAGAEKRAAAAAGSLGLPVVQALKSRNPSTGEIDGYRVYGDMSDSMAVIDDICDGGATFIHLAKALPKVKLSLFVTHGIFSRGLEPLRAAGYVAIGCYQLVGSEDLRPHLDFCIR